MLTQGNFSLNSASRIRNNKQQQEAQQYWALDAEKREGFVFLAPVLLHDLGNLALRIARPFGIPFVVLLLAFGETNFAFDAPALVMQVEWHQRVAGPFNLADQLFDFLGFEQKLAGTDWVWTDVGGGSGQGADVGAEQVDLALADDDVGFLELYPSGPDGFDLPAFQHHARLEAFLDEIIVEGFFIVDDAHERGMVGGRGPAAPGLEFKPRILSNGIMAVVHKSVLLAYSAEQMFALVDRVEDYPSFLPWCGGVEIRERAPDKLVAAIQINYHGVRQSFTTQNTHTPPTSMQMTLVEGPFSHLDGQWQFKPLREDACKIEFDLHYEFSSKLLEKLIGPVFSKIADSFVESFCKRAEAVYG